MFTEGYATSDGERLIRDDLCDEAIRLVRLVVGLAPAHPEARGLLALMLLHHGRRDARSDDVGDIVALDEQDRTHWNRDVLAEGMRQLDEALAHNKPGEYQIQAAIAALHAEAPSHEATDWAQIAGLYEALYERTASPNVAVSLSVAVGMAEGAERGLTRLDAFVGAGTLRDYDRVPAARAELLRRAGHAGEARAAYRDAIAQARNEREARFLRRRLAALLETGRHPRAE
jgi:RNA polymerase sigma-70 factor (ECF subfamily)